MTIRLLSLLAIGLLLSCGSPDPITQITVVIDSDLSLDRVRVQLFDHAGKKDATRSQDFRVSQSPSAGQYSFPLSFGLTPEKSGTAPSFRLVVTGYNGRELAVEQQVGSTFQKDQSLRLEVFLMSWCEGVVCPQPTNGWLSNFSCGVGSGTCGPLPDNQKLPAADQDDPLAGYGSKLPARPRVTGPPNDGPREEVCALCTEDYPCVKSSTVLDDYTCQGQWADWHMPDPTPGAKFSPKYDYRVEGVVTDEVTGLLWQRNLPSQYTGCSASDVARGDLCTSLEAAAYCEQLDLANQRWRLPSVIELQSIFDPTQATNFIDADAFPQTPRGNYWSRSPVAENTSLRSWQFPFGDEPSESSAARVRCVSGTPEIQGTPDLRYGRYISPSEDLVLDGRTDLDWQRSESDELHAFEAAKTFCASYGEGWRVPALNELISLVDLSRSHPAIDVSTFSGTSSQLFWTASAVAGSTSEAFAVEFDSGVRVRAPVNERMLVRCVR